MENTIQTTPMKSGAKLALKGLLVAALLAALIVGGISIYQKQFSTSVIGTWNGNASYYNFYEDGTYSQVSVGSTSPKDWGTYQIDEDALRMKSKVYDMTFAWYDMDVHGDHLSCQIYGSLYRTDFTKVYGKTFER